MNLGIVGTMVNLPALPVAVLTFLAFSTRLVEAKDQPHKHKLAKHPSSFVTKIIKFTDEHGHPATKPKPHDHNGDDHNTHPLSEPHVLSTDSFGNVLPSETVIPIYSTETYEVEECQFDDDDSGFSKCHTSTTAVTYLQSLSTSWHWGDDPITDTWSPLPTTWTWQEPTILPTLTTIDPVSSVTTFDPSSLPPWETSYDLCDAFSGSWCQTSSRSNSPSYSHSYSHSSHWPPASWSTRSTSRLITTKTPHPIPTVDPCSTHSYWWCPTSSTSSYQGNQTSTTICLGTGTSASCFTTAGNGTSTHTPWTWTNITSTNPHPHTPTSIPPFTNSSLFPSEQGTTDALGTGIPLTPSITTIPNNATSTTLHSQSHGPLSPAPSSSEPFPSPTPIEPSPASSSSSKTESTQQGQESSSSSSSSKKHPGHTRSTHHSKPTWLPTSEKTARTTSTLGLPTSPSGGGETDGSGGGGGSGNGNGNGNGGDGTDGGHSGDTGNGGHGQGGHGHGGSDNENGHGDPVGNGVGGNGNGHNAYGPGHD